MLKETSIEDLIGRRFIPIEGSRHQQIYEIDTDRNPMNINKNYEGHSVSYYQYYKDVLNIEIKDKNQPLILTKNIKPTSINKEKDNVILETNKVPPPPKYYIPELCTMIGINDDDMEDRKFMEKIIEKTRLEPDKKIAQIKKCLDLFYDTIEKKN